MAVAAAASTLRNMLVQRVGKKIVAVGRNYVAHAAEMNASADAARTSDPLIFLKPTSSYVLPPGPIVRPRGFEIQHEVELGVVIGENAVRNVSVAKAMDAVVGYVCAIDVTARNVQNVAKEKGHPWTVSKSCDTFCPISDLIPRQKLPDDVLLEKGVELYLKVNGQERQRDSTLSMVWTVPELISYVSSRMTLESGDIILTGTPSGVAYMLPGDVVEAGITNHCSITFDVQDGESSAWDEYRSSMAT
ncbi:Acylpyruvase FAHD1, mitochondrial [Porphyridium purpureum]|uniref:Acylpyruvase FAHD1, mitochondrial n=1 Tax=Porphyridium purpureum TaxID=35688 RepID=A0A5J4Z6T6_PORPP|nr:Acylpyruvase FAHD1, mitochondrial [Porphyridium purpureum]|eukprot:POR7911..scf295_1